MKHSSPDQFVRLAVPVSGSTRSLMPRSERLARWAQLLEARPQLDLNTLPGTEHQSPKARTGMRGFGSPISVAFADEVLRRQGLADDTYGEAKRFFALTDRQLHDIVCHCHNGEVTPSEAAARRVRAAIGPTMLQERLAKILFLTTSVIAYGGIFYCFSLCIAQKIGG